MTNDEVVRQELVALLDGRQAHMNFEDSVAGFPMEFANVRPPNVPYTPWQLLEHIRITQWDILEFVRNPNYQSPNWPEGYWPAPETRASESDWRKTVEAIQADLRAMKEMALDPAVDLYSRIPHGSGQTILREVMLVADHNAYHIGEFAILRQVMGSWPT